MTDEKWAERCKADYEGGKCTACKECPPAPPSAPPEDEASGPSLEITLEQVCLERMPGDRSQALATSRGAVVSQAQCVRDRPLAPATEAEPFCSTRGRKRARRR